MRNLVSIIIPTYNHEKFIARCVNSIISQTYDNWEAIFIDDNSTDNTLKILENFEKEDSRIKIIRHDENYGPLRLADTYNEGLKKSKGKLIAILEGDDFWVSDKLESQIPLLRNEKVVLCYGNFIEITSKGEVMGKYIVPNKPHFYNKPIGSIIKEFLMLRVPTKAITTVIKKEALKKIGGFKKLSNVPTIDYATFLNLSLQGSFNICNKILGFQTRHEKSVSLLFVDQAVLKVYSDYFLDFIKKHKKLKKFIKVKENDIPTLHEKLINLSDYYKGKVFMKLGKTKIAKKFFLLTLRKNIDFKYRLAIYLNLLSCYFETKISVIDYYNWIKYLFQKLSYT